MRWILCTSWTHRSSDKAYRLGGESHLAHRGTMMAQQYRCKMCGYVWKPRKRKSTTPHPKSCPSCKSTMWRTGERKAPTPTTRMFPTTIDYEDASNQGGQEWHACMWFDDRQDVPEACSEQGYNIATIEVPLSTVDVTWRNLSTWQTRPAAHPSERGCYMTMPLVLCYAHATAIMKEAVSTTIDAYNAARQEA